MSITDIVLGSATLLMWLLIILITLIPAIKERLVNYFKNNKGSILYLVTILATVALLGSLWYSEVIGYNPCKLCWYQRIFMYPIVLLGGIAAVYQEFKILLYLKAMAVTGLLISLYHIIEQKIPQSGLSCGSVGQAESCGTLWVNAFEFITIPVMAATIFVSIILAIAIYERAQVSNAVE